MGRMKLLIIEDDSSIVLGLYHALSGTYEVESAQTGQAGLRKIAKGAYDAILLDLQLPDLSGLEVCERIRSSGVTTPILVITGVSNTHSKVTLLDSGANDYLTKPFSPRELVARVAAVLANLDARDDAQVARLAWASDIAIAVKAT